MVSQEIKARKKAWRDAEPISGFTSYHSVACKLAWKQYSVWFPTSEDLRQSAALAAQEAIHVLGEETSLKDLCKVIDKSLYQQAVYYGMRTTSKHKVGYCRRIRREYSFCDMSPEDEWVPAEVHTRPAIGIGSFTYFAAVGLHRLMNLPDSVTVPNARLVQMRLTLKTICDNDEELNALRTWYLSRSSYFGYDAMEAEGFCKRGKGQRLIQKARELAGVQLSEQSLEMARRVASCYQQAENKRIRELGKQLGISKSSVHKWITIAISQGLLEPKPNNKQRVVEAVLQDPQASNQTIARRLALSKTSVTRLRHLAKAEGLIG